MQVADGTVRRVTCPGCCVEEHVVEDMTCENVNSTSSASHQAAFELPTQGCMNLPDKVALQMMCSLCMNGAAPCCIKLPDKGALQILCNPCVNGAAIDGEAAASRSHTWVLVDAAPDCGVHLQAVLELLGVAWLRKSAKGAVHRVKIQHLAVRQPLRCNTKVLCSRP